MFRRTLIACSVSIIACSSTTNTTSPDASVADTSTPRDPNKNCVKPGTPNNEKGVGGYCEPNTAACVSDAGIAFCTGAFAVTPPDAWFCTKPCSADPECGKNAYCEHNTDGNGCVPNACGTPPDAGAADASDAASSKDSSID